MIKIDLLLRRLGNYNAQFGGGSKLQALWFCFYWGGGLGPRISRAHSLLVNLKHRAEI